MTGTGVLAGRPVRCFAAEWVLRFTTTYPPAEEDLADVPASGSVVPEPHRGRG